MGSVLGCPVQGEITGRIQKSNCSASLMLAALLLVNAGYLTGQTGDTGTKKDQQDSQHKSDRVVGVIPAFNAEDDVNAPALSATRKFHLFTRTVLDPFNLIMPAVNAAILSGVGASSGYGSGFGGLAKRYGSSVADSISGNFFRLYAYPSLLHEDPRYFRAAHGSVWKRTRHVFGATIRTRKDDGSFRFNWSKLLASGSSSALSNVYYPSENRGARLTISRMGLSYLGEFGTNALKEFWADIARKH